MIKQKLKLINLCIGLSRVNRFTLDVLQAQNLLAFMNEIQYLEEAHACCLNNEKLVRTEAEESRRKVRTTLKIAFPCLE